MPRSEALNRLLDKLEGMIQEFNTTPEFQGLSVIEKSLSHSIITLVTRVIHSQTGKTPIEWDSLDVINAFLELFPNPQDSDFHFYQSVKPVMEAFLTYMRHEGLMINSKKILAALQPL